MNRRHFIKRQLRERYLAASGLVHKASAQNLPSPDPQNFDILDVDVLVVEADPQVMWLPFKRGALAKTVL